MKKRIAVSNLALNPCQPGRWCLSLPAGTHWIDLVDKLAAEAQLRWPGRGAVLDSHATLISNLRIWENLILPIWRRDGGDLESREAVVAGLLDVLGLDVALRESWVTRLPAMLSKEDRQSVVLMRALLIEPACVIIEDEFWDALHDEHAPEGMRMLFALLQEVPCVILCGLTSVPEGFTSVCLKVES